MTPVPVPPLSPMLAAREFYRVLSWAYIEKQDVWQVSSMLHTHLGCCVLVGWRNGGYVRDHQRFGRGGPPQPARVVTEVHVPTDVPRSLRCTYCWASLKWDLGSPIWHPRHSGPWYPFTASGLWECTPRQVKWWSWNLAAERRLWREHAGGIYEPGVVLL